MLIPLLFVHGHFEKLHVLVMYTQWLGNIAKKIKHSSYENETKLCVSSAPLSSI